MNKLVIITSLVSLAIGLLLGWLFFSSKSESKSTEHQHRIIEKRVDEWTCSMHPHIRQKKPGNCPICGMNLIPVGSTSGENNPLEIKMSPTAIQLAGVQTVVITKKQPVKQIRLTGKVQVDERSVTSQTTHISGRIEKLLVNATGEFVKKGQIISYIYSPELVTAQKELFEAKKIADTDPQLLLASKEKLKNWKLTGQQINNILKSKTPIENFPILADQSGIILSKKVNLGDHVMQGESIYEIADLSRVWVLFDIYESDMNSVRVGSQIKYTIRSFPGKKFLGTVSFIDPVIHPKTRVAKARVVLSNQRGQLKPEMFATGIVRTPIKQKEKTIIIPKSAVMWTGKKSVVYVKSSDKEGISFLTRKVTTGYSLGDSILIEDGLLVGEEIAIHGTFSIDAAAQLAGKPSMMNPEHVSEGKKVPPNLSKITISEQTRIALKPLYLNYLGLKETLARDDFHGAIKKVNAFKKILNNLKTSFSKEVSHEFWMKTQKELEENTIILVKAKNINDLRSKFPHLSDIMIAFTGTLKQPFRLPLYVQYCPMADNNRGANWLSTKKTIENPYFGTSMSGCGEVIKELK